MGLSGFHKQWFEGNINLMEKDMHDNFLFLSDVVLSINRWFIDRCIIFLQMYELLFGVTGFHRGMK